jgi:hypothetical protein
LESEADIGCSVKYIRCMGWLPKWF